MADVAQLVERLIRNQHDIYGTENYFTKTNRHLKNQRVWLILSKK